MFALAMFRLQGRAGPRDREKSATWLAAAAKLGHPLAAFDLALLYMEGELFPQDFSHAAQLLRVAADAGLPQAQYALGTLYKQGRGVEKDNGKAVHLFGLASLADLSVAQDRLAIVLANGFGVPANLVEAAKWHLVSKAAGETDLMLDDLVNKLDGKSRAQAENEAKPWIAAIKREVNQETAPVPAASPSASASPATPER
jgi:TPR repeat protein